MARQWKEIVPDQLDVWTPAEGDTIEGNVINCEVAGPNNSNLYTLVKEDGTKIKIWGNSLLDSRLGTVGKKDFVKIEYHGKKVSEKTKRSYHDYTVMKDEVEGEASSEEAKQS